MRQQTLCQYVLVILVLMGAGASACSSPTQPIATEAFPNSVGSSWIYAVYDSLTQERDTVEVRISDETQMELAGKLRPAKRLRLTPALSDSIWYVIATGDTIRVWIGDENRLLALKFVYVFPLEVGRRWRATACLDSTEVVARQEVPIQGGRKQTAYFLQSKGGCVNTYLKEDRWFAPGVGLLSINWWTRSFGFVSRNETWELISYQTAS